MGRWGELCLQPLARDPEPPRGPLSLAPRMGPCFWDAPSHRWRGERFLCLGFGVVQPIRQRRDPLHDLIGGSRLLRRGRPRQGGSPGELVIASVTGFQFVHLALQLADLLQDQHWEVVLGEVIPFKGQQLLELGVPGAVEGRLGLPRLAGLGSLGLPRSFLLPVAARGGEGVSDLHDVLLRAQLQQLFVVVRLAPRGVSHETGVDAALPREQPHHCPAVAQDLGLEHVPQDGAPKRRRRAGELVKELK
mmetsp:Transcript_11871/g.28194  ORF Transcript_11871/g.28194 Transcript_11871/m.28194 type:complete len:248 (+) Transcript_11871:470-1213(+)